MRRQLALLIFVLAVFVLAALLAPPIYWAVSWLSNDVSALGSLAEKPFPRFVSRILLVLAVAGLWPLVKTLKASRSDIGLSAPDWPAFGKALLIGLVTLGVLVAAGMLAESRVWRRNLDTERLVKGIVLGLAAAAIVAPLEEIVFRGVLFGLLRSAKRWIPALAVSSVFFAFVHFLQTPRLGGAVQWHSGFEVLKQMIVPADADGTRLVQAINLTLCGAVLAWAYQRTGNLWFSIGLHAGWIFWLKLANAVTSAAPGTAAIWGTRKVIDGWGATAVLGLTLILLPLATRRRAAAVHENPNPGIVARMG